MKLNFCRWLDIHRSKKFIENEFEAGRLVPDLLFFKKALKDKTQVFTTLIFYILVDPDLDIQIKTNSQRFRLLI